MLPLDVADPKSIAELARELPLVVRRHRLDLLVNGAGVLHSGERFGSVAAANLDDSFRTNARGPLLLTQALAPLLADGARVANITSELGSIAALTRFGTPSYNISKAAQNMATALLAKALATARHRRAGAASGLGADRHGRRGATLAPAQSVQGCCR